MTFKRIGFIAVGALLLLSPAFASADTAGDLQTQIQNLLAQIQQLQAQLAQLQGGGATPVTTDAIPSSSCPPLSATLAFGMSDAGSGGQVSGLQTFLADRFNIPIPNLVTGYFGSMTAQYVTEFQQQSGLPQVGIAGPLTRATIAQACAGAGNPVATPSNPNTPSTPSTGGGGGSGIDLPNLPGLQMPMQPLPAILPNLPTGVGPGGSGTDSGISASSTASSAVFSASPMSGGAPLSVYFRYTDYGAGQPYTLSFGDGSSASMAYERPSCSVATPNCQFYSASHAYTSAGTYTATLEFDPCGGNRACMAAAQILKTVTITVQ